MCVCVWGHETGRENDVMLLCLTATSTLPLSPPPPPYTPFPPRSPRSAPVARPRVSMNSDAEMAGEGDVVAATSGVKPRTTPATGEPTKRGETSVRRAMPVESSTRKMAQDQPSVRRAVAKEPSFRRPGAPPMASPTAPGGPAAEPTAHEPSHFQVRLVDAYPPHYLLTLPHLILILHVESQSVS